MATASFKQKFQDWFTQQWIILWGKKFNPSDCPWLLGPFGQVNDKGEDFIVRLAKKEQLLLLRNCKPAGLLSSITHLHLSEGEMDRLAENVINFYEKTSDYNLAITLKWNPLFQGFGYLVRLLFSRRIKQLDLPTSSNTNMDQLTSEIIQLVNPNTKKVHYTFWLRTVASSSTIVFLGIYGTCQLPNGNTAIKVIFPLPNGNATVLMKPNVGLKGELILDSNGKRWGDVGFYFLLQDTKGQHWAQYIATFKDKLIVQAHSDKLKAQQQLKLYGLSVLSINYSIATKP
ncbi:hypothetical protein [Myroides odoratus]|uniref:hypothetical protein n=1 Tax=Myroides odoratus TaxID=256 RepID=UPI0039B06539